MTTATAPPLPLAPVLEEIDGEFASWGRRVVAALLDSAILGALAFVTTGAYPGPLSWVPIISVGSAAESRTSLWQLLALGTLVVLQAYTGATPGKRVMSIAVVGEEDGRPIGLLRTLGREVCHLLDSLLLIGYLRPLWHPRRRTFADSICRTDVVRTRTPEPHRWVQSARALRKRTADDALPAADTGPSPASRAVTAAAYAACAVGLAFMGAVSTSGTTTAAESCQVRYDGRDTADPDGMPRIRLDRVTLQLPDTTRTETRLWISRTQPSTDVPSVYPVSWEPTSVPAGQLPPEGSTLELTLVPAGSLPGPPVVRATVENGTFVVPAGGTVVFEAGTDPWTFDLPRAEVDDLGPGWRWHASLRVPGRDLMSCWGTAPAGS